MSRALGLFRSARPVSLVLAGGQAPAYWQRELARSTARLDVLRQACAWVEALAAVRLSLREEPLLGRYLAALTDQVARQTGSNLESIRPQPPRSTWPERPPERDREMAPMGDRSAAPPWPTPLTGLGTAKRAAPVPAALLLRHAASDPSLQLELPPRRHATVPIQLEPQAGRALLSRLTDEIVFAEGPSRTVRRPIVETAKPKGSAPSSVPRDPASHQDWLRALGRRAGRSLRQDGLDVLGLVRRRTPGPPEFSEALSLADQWAIPLNRHSSSANPLARLAAAPVRYSNRSDREAEPTAAPRHTPGTWPSDVPAAPASRGAPPWPMDGRSDPLDPRVRSTGAPGADKDGSGRGAQPGAAHQRTSATWSPDLPGTSSVEDAPPWPTGRLAVPSDLLGRLAGVPEADKDAFGRGVQPGAAPQRPPAIQSPDLPDAPGAEDAPPWSAGRLTAPSDLLGRLAGAPEADKDAFGRGVQRGAAHQRTSATRSPAWPGSLGPEDAQPGPTRASAPTEGAAAVALPATASRTGDVTGEPESRARIVPPVVAPSLPPLLPSQGVSMPSPPVAAAIVRQGARREETPAAEDDLNMLAAKIKRILDEEARRHGIDV